MTTPEPKQKNTKAWIATIGSALVSFLPAILQFAGALPPPWGLIATGVGMIISAITGKATYQASNAPTGTVLVPTPIARPDGTITNPYK